MGNGGGLIKGAQPHNYRPPISAAIIAGGGRQLDDRRKGPASQPETLYKAEHSGSRWELSGFSNQRVGFTNSP